MIAWVGAKSEHVARRVKARLVAACSHIVTAVDSTWIGAAEAAAESVGCTWFVADHGPRVTRQTLASSSGYDIAKVYTGVVALSLPSFPGFLRLSKLA